jgi:hypothetical protein
VNQRKRIEYPPLAATPFEKTVQTMAVAFFFLVGVLILLALVLGVIFLGSAVFA